jgi:hypothetical protein
LEQKGMSNTSIDDHSAPSQDREDNSRSRKVDPSALKALFDEWMQGDETEQRETFEVLRRSLDEDRPAGYKLFS